MFAILLPCTLAPLVVTLVYGELKAKKLGLVAQPGHQGMLLYSADFPPVAYTTLGGSSLVRKVIAFAEQLDLIGLVLLGAAVALILLPITLVKTAGQWSDG